MYRRHCISRSKGRSIWSEEGSQWVHAQCFGQVSSCFEEHRLNTCLWHQGNSPMVVKHNLGAAQFSSPCSTIGTDAALILKTVNQYGNKLSPSQRLWTLPEWHPPDRVQPVQGPSPEPEAFPQGKGEIIHPLPLSRVLTSTPVCLWVLGTSLCQELLKPLFPYLAPHKFCPLLCSRLWRQKLPVSTANPLAAHCSARSLYHAPNNHAHTKDIPA